ncbi:MAG: hypothetical protein H6704_26085 [Myxococcales bacterium]|nr:hypothetical protein [Myxococcales bacterium]MCB9539697.1 hypothetical protein [Myxococcales bacterium]
MTSRRLIRAALLAALSLPALAHALPLYTARAGRTCDNCHSLPNTWFDPPEVTQRKCTLSCAGCHVDPGGGGLRTTSGRYYAASTVPMFGAEHRPLQDQTREVMDLFRNRYVDQPSSQPTSGALIPADHPVDPRPPGSPPPDDGPVFGRPALHGSSSMAWLDGRYGQLNADPLLAFGGDLRLGWWNQSTVFPMQADLYTSVHPVEHLTVLASAGIRGRNRGLPLDVPEGDDQDPVGVKDLWLMTHEWPALSYLRLGRFLPIFGTRVADHTAYIRRGFGLSQEDPANRVVGVEAGFSGNYPYLSASAFKPSSHQARDPFDVADGWGTAISGGYRELGWQLGGSVMLRRRPLEGGGDTTDYSVQWGLNPWYFWQGLPLTYLGEAVYGTYQRPLSGNETSQLATYHQLAWTAYDGVVLRLRYDTWDPDREVKDDEIQRPGAGLDLQWLPGFGTSVDGRVGLPAGGNAGADVFVQLHGYF